jgi:hypothetical protein
MIKALNRAEIIKIFEKIKSTNMLISELDLNLIEQETNYNTIHEQLALIFNNTEKYKEKNRDSLMKLFEKDKDNIFYFIKVLNDHRTKGNFLISENTLKHLGEIFQFINNLILNKNDMELFKFIFILSMTYYHLSQKDNKKRYLFSYIKDHPDYQKVKFWEDYLHELNVHELKGNVYNKDIENKKYEDMNKSEKEKLINCYFSNFLSSVKAMADFRLDKKFVRDFVQNNKEKYHLSQNQIENICMIYDISLNENENDYSGDFIDKEKKDNSNDNNNNNNINIISNKDNKDNNKKEDNKDNDKENNIINKDKDNIIEEKKSLNINKEEKEEKNNEKIIENENHK